MNAYEEKYKESEDKKIRNEIILYIGAKDDISLDTHNKWLSWLEKQGEKKPTWSEEDERLCQCLIKDQEEALDDVRNSKYGHSEIISDLKETYRERINWLESLKERLKGE